MEKEQKHSLANDIAEHVKLQQQYDSLYNQSMTILNSLPVAVSITLKERYCISTNVSAAYLGQIWKRWQKVIQTYTTVR